MKRNQLKQIVTITILITLVFLSIDSTIAEADLKKQQQNDEGRIKAIVRILYLNSANNEENAIQQMSYITFPNKLYFLEIVEFLTSSGGGVDSNYDAMNFCFFAGRPFSDLSEVGSIFGWAGRIQSGTNQKPVFSGGLNWDISNTKGLQQFAGELKIRTFLQSFLLKNNPSKNGLIDFYHYLELSGISQLFYIRGITTYDVFENDKNFICTFWDVIFPQNKRFDVFFRYSYQNMNLFNRGKGNQLSFGMRINILP